jgi:hypothetical protein
MWRKKTLRILNTKPLVMDDYRTQLGQTTSDDSPPPSKKERKPSTNGDSFHRKLCDKDYESFNSVDLVFYFQWIATRAGYRYSICSFPKEAGAMKTLLKDYTPQEICKMIEFVYESDQTYLDKRRLSPGILTSNWRNNIFPDSVDWLAGEYETQPKNKQQASIRRREWGKTSARSATIGEWDDD